MEHYSIKEGKGGGDKHATNLNASRRGNGRRREGQYIKSMCGKNVRCVRVGAKKAVNEQTQSLHDDNVLKRRLVVKASRGGKRTSGICDTSDNKTSQVNKRKIDKVGGP
jgi:hypothetical protein